jgi:hypothetical protein
MFFAINHSNISKFSHFKIAEKIIKGGNSNLKEMKFQSKQVTVVTV